MQFDQAVLRCAADFLPREGATSNGMCNLRKNASTGSVSGADAGLAEESAAKRAGAKPAAETAAVRAPAECFA